MVIDTSAIIAWLRKEPEAPNIREALISSDGPLIMSALSVYETCLVLKRRFAGVGLTRFNAFLHAAGVEVHAFDRSQAELSFDAFRRFGQG